MGFFDFLTADYETRQGNTRRLREGMEGLLSYYLGPTGIPDKLYSTNALLNPIAEMADAGANTVVAFDPERSAGERRQAAINAALGTITAAAPAIGGAIAGQPARQAVMETLANVTGPMDDAATRFIADEDGSFGGIRALTADHAALARAEDMAAAGASRDDIWRATGWFRGVDGKWRFEIDDSAATLNDYITSGAVDEWTPYDSIRMGETLSHNALYGAYPDMADIRSTGRVTGEIDKLLNEVRGSGVGQNYRGQYDPNGRGIKLTTSADDMRPVALHELQHDIQHAEGFATGGSPSQMAPQRASADVVDWRKISPLMRKYDIDGDEGYGGAMDALNRVRSQMYLKNAPFSEIGIIDAERARVAKIDSGLPSGYELYRRLAGEAEARNVEARRDFTLQERRETPPWVTQDVPDERQIVKFRGGGGQSSVDPVTQRGDEILGLLSSGRANEVTDAMLDLGDPVANTRLNQYLFNNYDLPMDEASRMARAGEMGFGGEDFYHGGVSDFPAFKREFRGSVAPAASSKRATWAASDPDVAAGYVNLAEGGEVQRLIDASYRAEADGSFDLADELMRQAEDLEMSGVMPEGGNIIAIKAPKNQLAFDAQGERYDAAEYALMDKVNEAQRGGYDAVRVNDFVDNPNYADWTAADHIGVFDPSNIRSRFARFDPRLKHLANLNAALGGLAVGGGLLNQYQDDQWRERVGLLGM